jgi:hypothetical protein
LAEHWASIPKVVGSIPTVVRHIFQACPVWIYTQSNITSIIFTWVHYTNTNTHDYTKYFDRLCFVASDWGKLQTTYFILRFCNVALYNSLFTVEAIFQRDMQITKEEEKNMSMISGHAAKSRRSYFSTYIMCFISGFLFRKAMMPRRSKF